MRAHIDLEGARELHEQLRLLPDAAVLRIIRPALMRAGRFLARHVRRAAPRGETGNLKRAVGVETPRNLSRHDAQVKVGFKRGRGRHAHLVEKGTGERRTKTGASRGAMPRLPFFAPAIETNTAGAFDVLRIAWSTRLAIEANRIKNGLVKLNGRLVR